MNHSPKIILGIILFTAATASVVYILLKTGHTSQQITEASIKEKNSDIENQINTSDWETYLNEEIGFSFKYPSDLVVQVDNRVYPIGDGSLRVLSIEKPGSYSPGPFTEIYFFDGSIESAINANKEAFRHEIFGMGDFVVGGQPAKIIHWVKSYVCHSHGTKNIYVQTPSNTTLIFTVNEQIDLSIRYATEEVELFQNIIPTVVF